jgi:hypothetical protein
LTLASCVSISHTRRTVAKSVRRHAASAVCESGCSVVQY